MIYIEYDKQSRNFVMSFSFNQSDLTTVKELPVRSYDKKRKKWYVPELAVDTLQYIDDNNVYWDSEALQRKATIKRALSYLVNSKFAIYPSEDDDYLRTYQQMGVNFLTLAKKAILADDMGLGKTIQAIKSLLNLNVQRALIICPATLKWNWYNEFIKHFDIEPTIVTGTYDQRKEIWNNDARFLIVNYDILRRDWEIMPKKWDAVVCDEAVYLKNPKAQRTKLVKKLVSDVRIALSGMPIENNLLEFYSIFEWVRPDVVPSFARFKSRYIKYDWSGSITGYKNLHEIHLLTSPYILRREKNKVLTELPDKIYSDFPLELNDKVRKAYLAICQEYIEWLQSETGNSNWHHSALLQLIRLRQFVEFPENVGFDNLPSVKLDWLRDTYSNLNKMVVFVNFKNSVELLKNEFNTKFIITGDTPTKNRVPMVNEFNEVDNGMFILTDAGKFGLNITGASYIVNMGYSFNPATMMQREDRLHRIGQKNSVNVFNPYVVNSIDQGIRSIYATRAKEAKNFMEGSEQDSVSRLTKRDFEKMISGGL